MISEKGFNVCRVNTYSDHDCLTTWRAFTNIENRYKYDPNQAKLEVLEQVGANFAFGYQKTHRILTVASRDVYQMLFWDIEPNGKIYLVLFE